MMMNFQEINKMLVNNNQLNITITKVSDVLMAVSVLPKVSNMSLSPLTLSGTSEELDKEFMNTIFSPMQKTFNIASNKEEYEKQLKEEVKEEKTKAKKVIKEEPRKGLFEAQLDSGLDYTNTKENPIQTTSVMLEELKPEKAFNTIAEQKDWTKEAERVEELLDKTLGEDTSAIIEEKPIEIKKELGQEKAIEEPKQTLKKVNKIEDLF